MTSTRLSAPTTARRANVARRCLAGLVECLALPAAAPGGGGCASAAERYTEGRVAAPLSQSGPPLRGSGERAERPKRSRTRLAARAYGLLDCGVRASRRERRNLRAHTKWVAATRVRPRAAERHDSQLPRPARRGALVQEWIACSARTMRPRLTETQAPKAQLRQLVQSHSPRSRAAVLAQCRYPSLRVKT
jgi:hypothetical protein